MIATDATAAAAALLERLPVPIALVLPDGLRLEPAGRTSHATVVFRNAAGMATLLGAPSLLAFGEAFIAEEIDLEGDLLAALEAAYAVDALAGTPAVPPPARPPAAEAVRHHYDLPPEFYALFLDRRLVYSCAYFRRPSDDLDTAQAAKLELICRKLDLAAGEHLLDLGCGFGGLIAWAAAHHGVDALGVTLSAPQAAHAARVLLDAGLSGRARVEHHDYRDLEGEARFDKLAAVGLIEHVGIASYASFFAQAYRLLRPGGLFLNHGITHARGGDYSTGMTFLTTHVFPGAEFERVSHLAARVEDAGFRIVDVEALGGHYARTTAAWLERLQANATPARRLVGERRYRTWVAYLAAATVAFRTGWIDLHQILAHKPGTTPVAASTRQHWYD